MRSNQVTNNAAAAQRKLAAEQAAAWIAAINSGELSPTDRKEFTDWLCASPLNVAEMLRMGVLDQCLAQLSQWPEVDAFDESNVSVLAREAASSSHASHSRAKRRLLAVALLAASVATIVIAAFLLLSNRGSTYRTPIGDRREVTLTDGSVINIAPATTLRVRLTPKRREVFVEEGGAYFRVAKNVNRPFIVHAGSAQARAVGTAFSVEHSKGDVLVTVVEGKVAVSEPKHTVVGTTTDEGRALVLLPDQQVAVSTHVNTLTPRTVDGRAAVAWAEGKLVFIDDTVADAVARFNVYNRRQLRISDSRLAQRRISGTFRASDPESFVDFLRVVVGEEEGAKLSLPTLNESSPAP